jgi:hypothetical protein
VNELAAPVLCLNLPATGNAVAESLARTAAESGEPVHLTLRMLCSSATTSPIAKRVSNEAILPLRPSEAIERSWMGYGARKSASSCFTT